MAIPAESIFFDLWSSSYDRAGLQQTTYRPVHDAVLRRLDDVEASSVLDLGCGTGHLVERLVERFADADVVGVDLSDGMLGRARDRSESTSGAANGDDGDIEPHAAFVRADAQTLPFSTDSFDLVTCTESFHWYADQASAVAEVARVLRPGGRLVIASIATVTGFADDAIQRATELAGRPIRPIPKKRLRELLVAGGFDVTHQGRVPRLGFVPWPMLTDASAPPRHS